MPWYCCTWPLLRNALNRLRTEQGISLLASFEQEFQLFGATLPPSHALSFAALRSADEYTSHLTEVSDQRRVELGLVRELTTLANLSPSEVCDRYRTLY